MKDPLVTDNNKTHQTIDIFTVKIFSKYGSCLLPIGPSFGKRQAPSLGTHSDTFGCLCVPEVSVSYRGEVCNVELCLCTGNLSGGTVILPTIRF